MLISDAAPKGLIFELSPLHGYGYCQTYFFFYISDNKAFDFVDIRSNVFSF